MATRRSLILAGGGLKVAFQAGALQVWLDEAGLKFDHVDGASGGVFNLAMMCQGMSGGQIAENWRRLTPSTAVDFNAGELVKLFFADSLVTLDPFREEVFPLWGIDFEQIRASALNATFNVYNFSKHDLEVIEPRNLTEDLLIAAISLPMWFPPVRIGEDVYIDSVFLTDANLEEAIRRGADELWVIWTVSDKSEWHSGFLAQYFQIIETASVGRYRDVLKRIAANNAALGRGEHSEFGRPIEVKELKADVPMHYIVSLGQDRVTSCVNLGVERAREWCREQNIPFRPLSESSHGDVRTPPTRLSFSEDLRGYVGFGEPDPEEGARNGRKSKTPIECRITITVDDVNRFLTGPTHAAVVGGWVECDSLGGKLPIEEGTFNLFVEQRDTAVKKMFYRLFFKDAGGLPLTLSGHKLVHDDPGFDLFADNTTLFFRILKGHVLEADEAAAARDAAQFEEMVTGSGILSVRMLDFLKQLGSLRVDAATISDQVSATSRFGMFLMGRLWDVYARGLLTSGPF